MFYLGIIASIFWADFIIKRTVDKKLALGEKKTYANGKIILQKYYNKGFALDKFEKYPKLVAYGSGFVCSLLIVKFCMLLFQKGKNGTKTALAMIIGGAASNLYDRFRKKHVIDYVRFGVKWKSLRKIVFNISDFFIILGALLLLVFQKKED
jgi:signal peptidase II